MRPSVYLAGPVEKVDTWRKLAAERLTSSGLRPINPLRNETIHFESGGVITSDIPDNAIVARDLNDLKATSLSGGFCLMNLQTSDEGRRPIGSLFELQYCYDHSIPVIAVMGEKCDRTISTHPWVRNHIVAGFPSVEEAIDFILSYMSFS